MNGSLLAVGKFGTADGFTASVEFVEGTRFNVDNVLATVLLVSEVLWSGNRGECVDAISGVGVRGLDIVEQLEERGLQLLPLKIKPM